MKNLKSHLENIAMKLEPLYETPHLKNVGQPIDTSLYLQLSNGREVKVKDVLKNGSLILVFIKGTWCPFCRIHLRRLREWVLRVKHSSTLIVVSSENRETINTWLKSNNIDFLFASDPQGIFGKHFGVWVESLHFTQASTFLIDQEGIIRSVFVNRREDGLYMEQYTNVK